MKRHAIVIILLICILAYIYVYIHICITWNTAYYNGVLWLVGMVQI